jgi:hemoglobin/transferrin/lactoferrin receptor protein
MKRLLVLITGLLPLVTHGRETLETIVVTATRIPLPATESAYTGNYFNAKFMEDNTRRNLPDALNLVPGVLSQKTTYGHGSPFIRGQTGRANLLLVDGIRLNNATWRGGPVQYWNTVDAYVLDRVELIKSQGSVPYGSDAVGGTLNAFTKASAFERENAGEFYSHGAARYEYRSNGQGSSLGRLEGAVGRGGSWGLIGGLSLKDFGDIEDSAVGRMKNTGYEETDWDMRYDASVGDAARLTLAYQSLEQDDVWRWHRTLYSPGWKHGSHVAAPGSWVANIYDQGRELGYARLRSAEPSDGLLSRWSATLSYQDWSDRELQDRRTAADQPYTSSRYRQVQNADVRTHGADFEFESPMGPGRWVYGLDYYQDEVDSSAYRDTGSGYVFRAASRPVADDSTYSLFGAWGQYLWQATDSLRVEGGARYTHANADIGKRWDADAGADVSSKRDWDNVVFSLRGFQALPGDWSLYGGVSQAFRAPNLNDLSGATTSRSGVESGGSVDVDPERYVTYEIGSRRSGPDVSFNVAVFYTDIRDIILDVPVADGSGTSVATNGQDGYIYGFEAEAGWQIGEQWLLSGFLGWQKGETTAVAYIGGPAVDQPYSRALPLSGSLAVRWTHPSNDYWIEGRVVAAETADRLSASDIADRQRIPSGGTPSYVVPMLHAGWQAHEHIALTLGLENLTDEDYRNHGSGNNEPGFNAILALQAAW